MKALGSGCWAAVRQQWAQRGRTGSATDGDGEKGEAEGWSKEARARGQRRGQGSEERGMRQDGGVVGVSAAICLSCESDYLRVREDQNSRERKRALVV